MKMNTAGFRTALWVSLLGTGMFITCGTVSQLFGACPSQCGEVTRGCGLGICDGGSFCDSCLCYSPASPISQTCCPGGTGNFQIVYENPSSPFDFDHGIAGLQTLDTGFILVGFGDTANVVRTGEAGQLVWAKFVGVGSSPHAWWDVAETSDGFVLTGDGGLAKLDATGSLVWAKALPSNGTGYGVTETSDGGFVVVGTMSHQAFLLKTDANGSLQWGWTYGRSALDEARSVVELPTGGFMVFGSTQRLNAGDYDLLFIQTDGAGTVQWVKTAGGAGRDSILPYRMIGTADGGFVVVTLNFVVKLDASAGVMWANTYGSVIFEAIAQTPHGYFVMGTRGEEFLMALAPNGDPQWARKYGDTPFHNYLEGGVTFDGGAFLATESHISPVGTHKFLLVKTDADGHTKGCINETSFSVTANKVPITTVATTLTAHALSGQLSPAGVTSRDGGLVERTLCHSSPSSLCDASPVICHVIINGPPCWTPLPPL
jgi:hypothetical protein